MLEVSKARLMDSWQTVAQVSRSLYFEYPQHFIRFFKKMTGSTPRQYRAEM
ncbi:MAG: helix-turn-helix domain-containing protein [Prevotella sp.]